MLHGLAFAAAARVRLMPACAAALVLLVTCTTNDAPANEATPSIVLHDDPVSGDFGVIEVHQLDAATRETLHPLDASNSRWLDVLDVRVPGGAHPVAGRYELIDDRIRFTPRFPPIPEQPWRIRFTSIDSRESIDTMLHVTQAEDSAPTRIVSVYPDVDTVPMNLLRAYVQFSSTMSEGEAYDRIRLLDASGEPVPDAFLVLEHELWDAERTRFTLLFDPGRIKRGLIPNEELGLPLQAGKSYTLVIDGDWNDGRNRRLAHGHAWTFHAGPPDRVSPRVDEWSVMAPPPGTRDPIRIDAGEPLDQALFERLITVLDASGARIDGTTTVTNGGSLWTFRPSDSWIAGEYTLRIGTELEDLAGNNFRHLFDVDRTDRQDTGVTADHVTLLVTVR